MARKQGAGKLRTSFMPKLGGGMGGRKKGAPAPKREPRPYATQGKKATDKPAPGGRYANTRIGSSDVSTGPGGDFYMNVRDSKSTYKRKKK